MVVVELEEEEERRDETRASDRKPFAGWPADRPRSSRGRREGRTLPAGRLAPRTRGRRKGSVFGALTRCLRE